MLEFAIILPLMVLLLTGLSDLGRAYSNYIIVTNAAREGARYGARLWWDGAGIQAAVARETRSGSQLTCAAPAWGTQNDSDGKAVYVTVSCSFRTMFQGAITLRNTVRMKMEGT